MNEAIQFILALQDYDIRHLELEQKLANIPQEIKILDDKIEECEKQFSKKKEGIRNQKEIIGNFEQNLKFTEDQMARDKYTFALIRNPKEYAIFSQKLDEQKKKIEKSEEELIFKLLEFDEENLQFESERSMQEEMITRIKKEKDEKQAMALQLKENCNEIGKKIMTIRQILREHYSFWLERYDATKNAIHKMPCIVKLKNNQYCGGCNIKLSGNNFKTCNAFPVVSCESCGRLILIIPEDVSKEIDDYSE